jgi:hypothetical protein
MPGLRLIEITRPDWIEHVQKSTSYVQVCLVSSSFAERKLTEKSICTYLANFQNYVKVRTFSSHYHSCFLLMIRGDIALFR